MTSAVAVHHRIDGPGDAPVLVLSHSLGNTLAMWDPQVTVLAQHYRLVRYDLRGHGESPVPPGSYDMADLGADLLALLDRLACRRSHLCGLSLGAMVTLWVASHHPERVDRLVVCCTAPRLDPSSAWTERAASVRAHGTASVADAVVARWFTPEFQKRRPERVEQMRATIARTDAAGYAGCCDAISRTDLRPDLGTIRAPTLAIAGAQDPVIPPERMMPIREGIADCRMAVVDGAAHLANVEQPGKVNELIVAHLAARAGA